MRDDTLDGEGPDTDATSLSGDRAHRNSTITLLSSTSAGDPLGANDFALDQEPNQVMTEDTSMVIPNTELDLSLTSGELLDPITMNDIWQIPALVRFRLERSCCC